MQTINNTPADSGLGDTLKIAFDKVNANFDELVAIDSSFSGDIQTLNTIISDGSTLNHTHTISQIIGLQTALSGKVSTSTFNTQILAINVSIQAINSTLSEIIDILNTKIGDAPFSGVTYGRQDGEWVEIISGTSITRTSELINDGDDGISHFISNLDLPSNLILYATTVSATTNGFFKLVTSITDPAFNTTAEDVSTGAITTTSQLISSLITAPGIINGNPGVFNITTIGNIRKISGSGEASFFFRVYKRTSGGTETLIATSDNTIPVIDGGTYVEFSSTALWNDGEFLLTDSIVLKFYANRIASGSNPTYQFQFGGLSPVRTLVPIPLYAVPGGALDSLSDVTITSPSNKQVLEYETSTGLWKNKTLNTSYLPLSGGTVTGPTTFTDPNLNTKRIIVADTSDGMTLGDNFTSPTALGLYCNNSDQIIAELDYATNIYKYGGGSIQFNQNNFITNITGSFDTVKGTNDGVDRFSNLNVSDYAMYFIGRDGSDYDNFGYSRFVVSPEEGFYSITQNATNTQSSQIQALAYSIISDVYTEGDDGVILNTVTNTDTTEYLRTYQTANSFKIIDNIYSTEGLFRVSSNGTAHLGDLDYSVNGTHIIVSDDEQRIYMNASEGVFINGSQVATFTDLNEDYTLDTFLNNQLAYIIPGIGVTAFIFLRAPQITQVGQTGYFGQPTAIQFNTTAVAGTIATVRGTNITIGTTYFVSKIYFRIITDIAGTRFFNGFSNMFRLAAPSNVEPDTLINSMGVCKLSTSDNLHFMYNDNSGLATTIDCGINFPATSVGGYSYNLEFIRRPTDTNVTMTLVRNDGLTTSTVISSNIPTGAQSHAIYITNNATASIASFLHHGAVYKTL